MQLLTWSPGNWLPFLVGAILGIILGWSLTALAKGGSTRRARARIAELESTLQTSEDELVNVRLRAADLQTELESVSGALSQAQADAESAGMSVTGKDTALADAYHRVASLQRELEEERRQLAASEAQTADLQSELSTLTSASQEWAAKLHEARGQVVDELAQLTSAMLRVKEESLARADATIADLTRQLNNLKTGGAQ